MRRIVGVMSTNHVDSHGDMIDPDLLRAEATRRQRFYGSVLYDHDARLPPVGRSVRHWIEEREGGIVALMAEIEVFEADDLIHTFESDGRGIELLLCRLPAAAIFADTSYYGVAGESFLRQLSAATGGFPVAEYAKKGLISGSALIIALGAGYVIGKFLDGMLEKFGADFADRVSSVFQNARLPESSGYVEIAFGASFKGRDIEVLVLVEKDSNGQAILPLAEIASRLDKLLPSLDWETHDLARVVFSFGGDNLDITYRVRRDGVPLELTKVPNTSELRGLSIGFFHDRK